MVTTRWGGLRLEPYDPDARDGDNDGIVQEGTAWERPAGTRLLDNLGREIRRGITGAERPRGMRVVDRDGRDVPYTPSYGTAPQGGREAGTGKPTPLNNLGYPSLKERGLRSVQEIVAPEREPQQQTATAPPQPIRSALTTSTAMARPEEVQKAIADFDALPDDQPVVVFHGTTAENADAIRASGTAGFVPRGDDISSVTRGRGMYVAATPQDAQMYAGRDGAVVAVTVPKGSLTVPPEMTTPGATSGYALYNPSAGALIPEGTTISMADAPEPDQDWTPRWSNIPEALDMEYVRQIVGAEDSELDDDDILMEFYQPVKDDWETWDACRGMRKGAYELAGVDISPADPNIERSGGYFGNGWGAYQTDSELQEKAKYLMASLVQDVRSGPGWDNPTLYRAVDVPKGDRDDFWQAMQPGSTVDVPLWSFADRRSQGDNEILTRYGSDVLFVVDGKPHSLEMGVMGGYYDAANERETLDGLSDVVDRLIEDRDSLPDGDENRKGIDERIDEIQQLLKDYSRERDRDKRRQLRADLGEILTEETGDFARWEGEEIPEDDSELFYASIEDPWSNRSTTPVERISGGRFEVVAVEDDPAGTYGNIVRLRQVGAFDPAAPGQIVKVGQ